MHNPTSTPQPTLPHRLASHGTPPPPISNLQEATDISRVRTEPKASFDALKAQGLLKQPNYDRVAPRSDRRAIPRCHDGRAGGEVQGACEGVEDVVPGDPRGAGVD